MVKPEPGWENRAESGRMTAQETADIINRLILQSQEILANSDFRKTEDNNSHSPAGFLSIWPWGGGYRPAMKKLSEIYPQITSGSVISAVDLIKGIGHYAGLKVIKVEGATGLADTNYEGKAQAALDALRTDDFVFLHVEASDEAGHDGDLDLKIRTIENLDKRLIGPILKEVSSWSDNPVAIALLPDHPTPVEVRTHVNEPVPFAIWSPNIKPDGVRVYDEESCVSGDYGLLRLGDFMQTFLNV